MKNNEKIKKFIKFGLCAVILLATVLGTIFISLHKNEDDVKAALSGSLTTSTSSNKNLIFSWSATQNSSTNKSTVSWTLTGGGSTSGYVTTYPVEVRLNGGQIYYSNTSIQLRYGTQVASGSFDVQHDGNGNGSFTIWVGAGIYSHNVNASTGQATFYLETIVPPVTTYWTNINVMTPEGTEDTANGASFDLQFSDEGSLRNGLTNEPVPAVYKSSGVTLTLYNLKPLQSKYVISSVDGATWNGSGYVRTTGSGGTITIQLAYKQSTISFDKNTTDEVSAMPESIGKGGSADITIPSTIPIREGYDFIGWSPTANEDVHMGDGKQNSDGTCNGWLIEFNNSYIKRAWIKKVSGSSKTFEVLVYAENTSSVSIPTWTENGGQDDLIWHGLNGGSWERNGYYFNFGNQFSITDHKDELARYMTHIYAYNSSGSAMTSVPTGYYNMEVYPGETYVSNNDITLYAQWKPSEYKVTFDANGGELENTNYRVSSSREILATIAGRTFYKAYDGEAYVAYLYNTWGTTPILVSKDKNAVAHFDSYDCTTIHDYDSTSSYGGTLEYNGETYYFLTSIHVMQGDYMDSSNLGRLKLSSVEYIDAVIELLNRATEPVSSTTKTVEYAQTYGELPTPTRVGHTFVGWYYEGEEVTSDTVVDIVLDDHTLVAMWTQNYYNVTYHAVGGEFEDGTDEFTTQVLYGEYIDLSYIPVKDGRAFIGWSLDEEDVTCVMSMQMPAESVDFYAVYSIPVSNISHVVLRSYDLYDNLNEFEMIAIEETLNGYYYWIEGVNLLDGLVYDADDLINSVAVDILVYDNAGNYTKVPVMLFSIDGDPEPDVVIPEVKPMTAYTITTKHYAWNVQTEEWNSITDRVVTVKEGDTFKPEFLSEDDADYPKGFVPESIEPDVEFEVEKSIVVKAYYMPTLLKVYFDPNGGSCDLEYKELYPHQYYGELPTAVREGYDFLGWYTEPTGGTIVKDSDEFNSETDITLYAHWKKRVHTVMYDYMTNGGTSVDMQYIDVEYGNPVDLGNQAYKGDWEFIGWNTDPNATDALDECTMGDDDIVLYAIYKKDITATYIDRNGNGKQTRTETVTIYNTTQYAEFVIPIQNVMTGWECLGWSESGSKTFGDVEYSSDTTITLTEDLTLYGLYVQYITLSYDMNGSQEIRNPETKERYHNANGNYTNPEFTIATAPSLEGYSFVQWVEFDEDGYDVAWYDAEEVVTLSQNTELTATWDKIPEISAYDRYFTLADAQNGNITEEALLEKVLGTDLEDGTLVNGVDVVVKGYRAEDFEGFTSDGSVSVTYEATDSFGNSVTKTVTVYIVDTTSIESNKKDYIRFISKDFYLNEDGTFVSKDEGGLDSTSLWITNVDYANVLTQALTNTKASVDKSEFNFLGTTYEVVQPGSGDWKSGVMTYKFTKSQIEEAKEHISDNGYGKYLSSTGISDFIQKFIDCITIW